MLGLPRFDYVRPKDLGEAIGFLTDKEREPRVLAGGTDLFVQMKKGLLYSRLLVDIKPIPQLAKISLNPEAELCLGAGVTLSGLEEREESQGGWSVLSEAARSIGSQQVRNRATVVGNVCRASPAGDMAPGLIALDATAEIYGPKGKRSVLLEDFITGPGQTDLGKGEMVASVRVPRPPKHTSAVYLKLGTRRAMDLAIVAVAVRISLDESMKTITCARIVLGAVAPTPIRILEGEETLASNGPTPQALAEITDLAIDRANPITDLRATAKYRADVVGVCTRRAIEKAWRDLREGGR